MEGFCIGNDILDLGSRRVELRNRRLSTFEKDTHFELPKVSDVRPIYDYSLLLLVCSV